mmetsp:Transcript_33640/g.81488  ORF Transcript_33640/g.81488 Transcript_33640/m.81488 type:complete len:367 (-) Transcript_33640:78-1178(-)
MECTDEQVAFLLATRAFRRARPTGDFYIHCLDTILKLFIHAKSPMEINISGARKKKIVKLANEAKAAPEKKDYFCFRSAEREVYRMMKSDVFKRFCNAVVVQKNLLSEVDIARSIWRKKYSEDGPVVKSCTKQPNTISLLVRRIQTAIHMILLAVGAVLQFLDVEPYISAAPVMLVTLGFVLRAISGPRFDPQSYLVLFVLEPLLRRTGYFRLRFTIAEAPRLIQTLGAIYSALILACIFLGHIYYQWARFIACLLVGGFISFEIHTWASGLEFTDVLRLCGMLSKFHIDVRLNEKIEKLHQLNRRDDANENSKSLEVTFCSPEVGENYYYGRDNKKTAVQSTEDEIETDTQRNIVNLQFRAWKRF